eukprot:6202924-Pleurochrysis_carterae.AAC.1
MVRRLRSKRIELSAIGAEAAWCRSQAAWTGRHGLYRKAGRHGLRRSAVRRAASSTNWRSGSPRPLAQIYPCGRRHRRLIQCRKQPAKMQRRAWHALAGPKRRASFACTQR